MALASLAFDGRLPGVVCAPGLPARDAPIRLDVAGFVGFAERGPLDTPVAVEDVNQYRAVFGGDVLLAQDDGKPVYANLLSAVRAFFDNGGRRCHVVRVAPAATTAVFTLRGLHGWSVDGGDAGEVEIEAAWPGAWANRLRVGTTVRHQPLRVDPGTAFDAATGMLPITRSTAALVRIGDVLRVQGVNDADVMFAVIDAVVFTDAGPAVRVAAAVPESLAAEAHGDMDVVSASQIRFDIDVWEVGDEGDAGRVERWEDLACARDWLDSLQPGDTRAPDVSGSRSLRLRGPQADGLVFVPVGLVNRPPTPPTTTGADGLDAFEPVEAFTDAALRDLSGSALWSEVERLTVLSAVPARLRGVHALAQVDEVAMIAVPDAVHREWEPPGPPPADPPEPAPEPPLRDWTRFDPCAADEVVPPPPPPPPPVPTLDNAPLLKPAAAFDPEPMAHVQRAAVRLCAARADAVAVLSLPAHYDATAATEWRERLGVEASHLSYAAAWHPWLELREERTPELAPRRAVPPDGHAAGSIAMRELAAGAWAAPAHVSLSGAVALTPALSTPDTVRVFDAHLNPLVQKPRRFVALSAHTLSADPLLLQLSVRRLLILLRKLALVLGDRWVFESNNEALRARARTTFERLLGRLQARGALVDFMVVVPTGEAARIDADAGRFIVELRVAPTNPIEFITVTLMRNHEGVLDLLEA